MYNSLTFYVWDFVQQFVKAVVAYQKKLNSSTLSVPKKALKLDNEMEKKRKIIVRSFSLAKNLYTNGRDAVPEKEPELEAGAEFLEVFIISSLFIHQTN